MVFTDKDGADTVLPFRRNVQTKSVSTSGSGASTTLTFSDIIVGNTYYIAASAIQTTTGAPTYPRITIPSGASDIAPIYHSYGGGSESDYPAWHVYYFSFIATSTDVTLQMNLGATSKSVSGTLYAMLT